MVAALGSDLRKITIVVVIIINIIIIIVVVVVVTIISSVPRPSSFEHLVVASRATSSHDCFSAPSIRAFAPGP